MPRKPQVKQLTASAADILNTIRSNASEEYKNLVSPANAKDINSLRQIGQVMQSYTPIANEFINALVNRIGWVLIQSKMYSNPWSIFKRGLMEYGETVEDVFVNIAKPFQFNPERAENTVFKRQLPDVRAVFHTMNYQVFYKVTVSNDQLRQAFLSWNGITELIGYIIDSLVTANEYDEFLMMKYLIAVSILDGKFYSQTVDAPATGSYPNIAADIKGVSNLLTFMSGQYNAAGVKTFTSKNDQYLILNSKFDAKLDVDVLAVSFNMDKAEFLGHKILVDSFGSIDMARLNEIYEGDTSKYRQFTDAELEALDAIPGIIVDRNWWMVFDNFYNMTQQYNGEGLYWNYWLHTWKTFSVSPYGNAILLNPATPSVTSVTVSPSTASLSLGQSLQFVSDVKSDNFAPGSVTWSINSDLSSITPSGLLQIGPSEIATTITVTATSTFDSTKSATATVTVTNPAT